jgi:hypothetical protein
MRRCSHPNPGVVHNSACQEFLPGWSLCETGCFCIYLIFKRAMAGENLFKLMKGPGFRAFQPISKACSTDLSTGSVDGFFRPERVDPAPKKQP